MHQARNKLTAIKIMPHTTKVMSTVVSMKVQFEAIGVKYHGLIKWKTSVPIVNSISTINIDIFSVCMSFYTTLFIEPLDLFTILKVRKLFMFQASIIAI